jgi:guanylate kinase
MPPSIEELKSRLKKRNSESAEQFDLRIGQALDEISEKDHYDHVIINFDLEDAVNEVLQVIRSYRSKNRCENLIKNNGGIN